MLRITNQDIITTKIDAYKAGIFEPIKLLPKQLEAMRLLTGQGNRQVLFGGAAYGGKSFLGCEWLLWNCLAYPGTRWFIGRAQLKQIRQSVIKTFKKVCKKHQIPEDEWKYNDITVEIKFKNGSEIIGVELAEKPSDEDFDKLGSTEYTGGWIEEAGGVGYRAYMVISSRTGRQLNKEYGLGDNMLITCNPSRNWLYTTFYKQHKDGTLPDNMSFLAAFAGENKFGDELYYQKLNNLTGRDRARLLVGDWEYDDDPLALIEYDSIVDIFSNDFIEPDYSKKRMVCDIALHGSDKFRIGVFYGDVLMDHIMLQKSGGKDVLTKIKAMQAKHGIKGSSIVYDADGVGGFIGKDGGFIPNAIAFNGNAAPIKRAKDEGKEYGNLKAQCGFLLAEKINEGRIWAKAVTTQEDQETLSEELGQIKKAEGNTDGKLRLMPKEQIIQNIGRSPDFSDLLLMAQIFDLKEGAMLKGTKRQIATN